MSSVQICVTNVSCLQNGVKVGHINAAAPWQPLTHLQPPLTAIIHTRAPYVYTHRVACATREKDATNDEFECTTAHTVQRTYSAAMDELNQDLAAIAIAVRGSHLTNLQALCFV